MRAFGCAVCGNLLVVENSVCVACGTAQGFSPTVMRLVPVDAGGRAKQCRNLAALGCNWLVDDGRPDGFCRSCRLTRVRPSALDVDALAAWATTEAAKRRLVYQLLDVGLPVAPRGDDPRGLAFDLLSSAQAPVVTGHVDG